MKILFFSFQIKLCLVGFRIVLLRISLVVLVAVGLCHHHDRPCEQPPGEKRLEVLLSWTCRTWRNSWVGQNPPTPGTGGRSFAAVACSSVHTALSGQRAEAFRCRTFPETSLCWWLWWNLQRKQRSIWLGIFYSYPTCAILTCWSIFKAQAELLL